jgi:serine/threonine protein kinase
MLELNTSSYFIHIEDYLTLIMEYYNGGDLDKYIRRLKRRRPITLKKIQLVAWRIGLALNDMHHRNILHG